MKIKIEHISNTFNYGSLMMAINTLNYIYQNIEDISFYVDNNNAEEVERLRKETYIEEIYSAKKIENIPTRNLVDKVCKRFKIADIDGKNYDLKIILGGDDISEYYGKKKWLVNFPIMYIENKKLPTIFLGQTIGPFTGYNRILARIVLSKAIVYTRDDKCLEYVKKMGVANCKRGRDLAFLELPRQKEAQNIVNKYKLEKNQYINLVASGLSEWYTPSYEKYLEENLNIIKNLLREEKLKDKKVVLLAHVLKPKKVDDRNVINDLEKKLNDEEKKRVIFISDKLLASEAREILGQGLFTITGRMHAAVSTFYMRKPAISLSYSVKYEGVIGKGLDMNELVIECANEELWETEQISRQVAKKIDYVMEHYDKLIDKIDKNVTKTSEMSIKQLEDVVQDIRLIQEKRKKHR